MERLLSGTLPAGGRCDLNTLAREAGVPRTGFYPKGNRRGTYQDLSEEFIRRRDQQLANQHRADPRDAQISRLTTENRHLRDRLADQASDLDELRQFRDLAISRLAAQHNEIRSLRAAVEAGDSLGRLRPAPRPPHG
ncbi:hypothetical protein DMP23_47705 [Amycolatopsis sp. A1MSW2902]